MAVFDQVAAVFEKEKGCAWGVDVSRVTRDEPRRAAREGSTTWEAASPRIEPTHHKHTMKKILFVGMDVHAQSITLALASGDHSAARLYGSIPHDLQALEKVFEVAARFRFNRLH